MDYVRVLWLFTVFAIAIEATTHWMVTENGLIQPRVNSPFLLGREYDLIAFMNQDVRYENIITGFHDLVRRAKVISDLWLDLEIYVDLKKHSQNDNNCVKSGPLNMLDWYTSILEDGYDRHQIRHEPLPETERKLEKDVPDCKKISSLTFSMATFEHLDAMVQRDNLTIKSEVWPPEQLYPSMTVDQYGHWLAGKLRQNSSSWVHYNMASLYWRMRGFAGKALECSRRAVHYSPRRFKDIPLLSMGTVFHRAKKTDDAITVLSASIDHYAECATTRFIIGNAYAVIGDYNSSMKHLDVSLSLSPDFELARRHRYGVLCNQMALRRVDSIVKTIEAIQQELIEFRVQEAIWTKSQAPFLKTMWHEQEFDYNNEYSNCEKFSEITGLDMRGLKAEAERNEVIQTMLDGSSYLDFWAKERGVHAIEAVYTLQKLMRNIENHLSMASAWGAHARTDHLKVTDGQIRRETGSESELFDFLNDLDLKPKPIGTKEKEKEREDETCQFEGGVVLYPSSVTRISRNREDFDKNGDWPSQELCRNNADEHPKNLEVVYPVFLPLEHKGIRLHSLLTTMIGVSARVEHELPWHPPVCPNDKESFNPKKSHKTVINVEIGPSEHLRAKLLEYVADGYVSTVTHMQDAEIGQRIYSAMGLKHVPKWLVYTIASLYWRVRENRINAVNCLLAARTVPPRHRDVVMTSLSSLYLELGLFDDALNSAEEVFREGVYEPSVNFLLAQLNMVKQHKNTQIFHLKQVIRVEPNFMGGLVRRILEGVACAALKAKTESQFNSDGSEDQICTQVDTEMSMICDAGQTSCRIAYMQCPDHHKTAQQSESSIVRLIDEEKRAKIAKKANQVKFELIDTEVFDNFIDERPPIDAKKIDHSRHFEKFMKLTEDTLKGCGQKGCRELFAELIESDLRLSQDECSFYHLKAEYWMQIIDFNELLTEGNKNLIKRVASTIVPNTRKILECNFEYDAESNFFLNKALFVNYYDWAPVGNMMYAFGEAFFVMDSVLLGAKLAYYVEENPNDWAGLLAAGWWCGLSGRGACAVRCLVAAAAAAALPAPRAAAARAARAARAAPAASYHPTPLLSLTALLHINGKLDDAKEMSYLMFYLQPKSTFESFLVAVSHTYLEEYEQAIWMYRYVLNLDNDFKIAKYCLHSTICALLFGKPDMDKLKKIPKFR